MIEQPLFRERVDLGTRDVEREVGGLNNVVSALVDGKLPIYAVSGPGTASGIRHLQHLARSSGS